METSDFIIYVTDELKKWNLRPDKIGSTPEAPALIGLFPETGIAVTAKYQGPSAVQAGENTLDIGEHWLIEVENGKTGRRGAYVVTNTAPDPDMATAVLMEAFKNGEVTIPDDDMEATFKQGEVIRLHQALTTASLKVDKVPWKFDKRGKYFIYNKVKVREEQATDMVRQYNLIQVKKSNRASQDRKMIIQAIRALAAKGMVSLTHS